MLHSIVAQNERLQTRRVVLDPSQGSDPVASELQGFEEGGEALQPLGHGCQEVSGEVQGPQPEPPLRVVQFLRSPGCGVGVGLPHAPEGGSSHLLQKGVSGTIPAPLQSPDQGEGGGTGEGGDLVLGQRESLQLGRQPHLQG